MPNVYKDEVAKAMAAAAILGALVEDGKQSKKEDNSILERTKKIREVYDGFLAVGFTEDQATQFVCALLK